MGFDPADPVYQELLAKVLQSDARVVPFVGAGLSVYGNTSDRLPLWRELLDRLIAEGRLLGLIADAGNPTIDRALQEGHYIEATDRILEALGEPTFRRVVQRELDASNKPIPPAVAELVAIGWALIVTTNLDRQISRAYLERYGRPPGSVTSLDTHRLAAALAGTLASPDTTLAQIHGDVDVYPSWRLTRSHYEQLLRDPGYVEALKHLFLRQVFFVGFGLQDGDFDYLLETIALIYPAGVGEFFALVASSRKQDPRIQELVRKNGLRPIFYGVDPDPSRDPFGGHRAVFECLAHLASEWALATTRITITMKYFAELDPTSMGREQELQRLAEIVEIEHGAIVQVVGLGGIGKTSLLQLYLASRKHLLAASGFRQVFGCSFYRADVGQFIYDMSVALGSHGRSLAQQVDGICAAVTRERTMLILDGLEALVDPEHRLRNPYLQRIMDAVLASGGAVLTSTRVQARGGVLDHSQTLGLGALGENDIRRVMDDWGLERLGEKSVSRMAAVTGGHPLALRIIAGLLVDTSTPDALRVMDSSPVLEIPDDVDPMRENRLARVLHSYVTELDEAGAAFLMSFSVFDRPAAYPLVEATISRPYTDTKLNACLRDRDLRLVVADLRQRGLLGVAPSGEISSHPTVREYFANRTSDAGQSLAPLHRFLASELLRDVPTLPETFEESIPLITAARHAAACSDWTLFHDLFQRRLMRGFRNHLCNNLGAWEESLALARLGDVTAFPRSSSAEPAFYPITVARCLKHLGRSAESRSKYIATIKAHARDRHPDTAKYLNNLMTLLIWRGELGDAELLASLNVRALSWIDEEWKYRWQVEHGYSTFAYLRLLKGDYDAAGPLFDHAANAWETFRDTRLWIFDYYPYHRAELILMVDPDGHESALLMIETLLAVAREHGWPESMCRGHIQAAAVLLDRAERRQSQIDLAAARYRLEQARDLAAGMIVPDVAIIHGLTELRAEFVHGRLLGRPNLDGDQLNVLVERVASLIVSSRLTLAEPELLAARGMVALLAGGTEQATREHRESIERATAQGNQWTVASSRSLTHWLGRSLGFQASPSQFRPGPDLIGLEREQLTPDDLVRELERLD